MVYVSGWGLSKNVKYPCTHHEGIGGSRGMFYSFLTLMNLKKTKIDQSLWFKLGESWNMQLHLYVHKCNYKLSYVAVILDMDFITQFLTKT